MKNGFTIRLLKGTPDIFVNKENVGIEAKNLHLAQALEELNKVVVFDDISRIRARIDDTYRKLKTKHSNIMIFNLSPTTTFGDLEDLLINPESKMYVDRYTTTRNLSPISTGRNLGLYFEKDINGDYLYRKISGVAGWKKKIRFLSSIPFEIQIKLFENPNTLPEIRLNSERIRTFLNEEISLGMYLS